MRAVVPLTIFGHVSDLDSLRMPGKSSSAAAATSEFCRMKIDFRQNATKLGREEEVIVISDL
jgi:hypothetical protein